VQEGNPAGQRLVAGRYAVLGELGRGGIGVVWRAHDQVIGRQVALKELRIPPGLGREEHDLFVQRVLREARTAGALNDPAIVTVYDVVPEGGAMYIVMELIEATTLTEEIARGPLSEQRATELGRQVLSALQTAHAAGIVHRDIKPSNIMVLPGDRVKLTDFGIAQAMDDPSLTATGGIMGSPGYMAPELFQGEPPSPATDLWSLGATLFHVVEGRAPFQRDSTAATMHAIMYDDPRLHRCTGPLASVIMGLLVHAPEQRLTAAQVQARLSAPSAPADVERTDVLPAITADPDRTAMVDRDRTTAVTRRPRTTRPWGEANEANEFTELVPDASAVAPATNDQWGGQRRNPKRALLIGAAAVVVLALIGAAFLIIKPGSNAVASPPPTRTSAPNKPSGPATATSGATATSTTAPTSAATSAPTATSTTRAPGAKGGSGSGGSSGSGGTGGSGGAGGSSAPQLSYVAFTRYNSPNGYHVSLTSNEAVPSGYANDGLIGDLVTTPNLPDTVKIYLCQVPSSYYFTSKDSSGRCEGQKVIGFEGYMATGPVPGLNSVPVYRCTNNDAVHSKFDSLHSNCEGVGTQEDLLGYVVRQ
jgi:serine/threonine protein kinase